MSNKYRANRKANDSDIITLNSVGLCLRTIGKTLGIHPTTVTQRLESLGISPADTRHTFMEDIFLSLDLDTKEWLAQQLSANHNVKEFVRELIIEAHNVSKQQP